jgi:hypothetical protein
VCEREREIEREGRKRGAHTIYLEVEEKKGEEIEHEYVCASVSLYEGKGGERYGQ